MTRGEPLCETDLRQLWGEVGPCLGITRVRSQEVLLAGAAAVPHRLGVALVALTQHREGVSVTFSDGSVGDYQLMVGADGVRSTVRRLGISPSPPRYLDTMAWRSVVPSRPRHVSTLVMLMGEGCFFGLVPVGGGQTYGFAGLNTERFDDPVDGRLDRFRRRFSGFGGGVPSYLDALERDEQLHSGPVTLVELERWHEGRVLLVGDAAHSTPPHMGDGGSMAMEDASCSRRPSAPLGASRRRSTPTPSGAGRGSPGCSSRA